MRGLKDGFLELFQSLPVSISHCRHTHDASKETVILAPGFSNRQLFRVRHKKVPKRPIQIPRSENELLRLGIEMNDIVLPYHQNGIGRAKPNRDGHEAGELVYI